MNEADAQVLVSGQRGFGFEGETGVSAPPKSRKAAPPPAAPTASLAPEAMARILDSHADYRVLRRLPVITHFAHEPVSPVTRVLILYTETTRLDASRDRIMENRPSFMEAVR